MAKILFITANPSDETRSLSMAAGKAFIETYEKTNPTDEIIKLDLYQEYVPMMDAEVIGSWAKLAEGQAFETLSESEMQKLIRLDQIVEQFMSADKVVFVTPMWNLGSPAVLKSYIDTIAVPGKTFKYTDTDHIGLIPDMKVLHIQARGGFYSAGEDQEIEMGDRYLKAIMGFMGVTDYQCLFMEGHSAMPHKTEEIKANGVQRAIELAKVF